MYKFKRTASLVLALCMLLSVMPMSAFALDTAQKSGSDASVNSIDVELNVGDVWTLKDTTGSYTLAEDSDYDTTVAQVTAVGSTATLPAVTAMHSGTKMALVDCMYTLATAENGVRLHHTLSNGTVVYIDAHAGASNGGYPNRDYTTDLTLVAGTDSGTFQIKDDGGSLHLFKEKETPYWDQCASACGYKHDLMFFRPAQPGESSEIFEGFVQVTDTADLTDGEYLIAAQDDNGKYYVLTPALGGSSKSSNDHLGEFTGTAEISTTTVTVTGLKPGTTQVRVGSNVYHITVNGTPAVELSMFVGGGVYFILDGQYGMNAVIGLDPSVVEMEMTYSSKDNVTHVYIDGLSEGENTFELAGKKYHITVHPEGYDPIKIPAAKYVYRGPEVVVAGKPGNGTTRNQPFFSGVGGSGNFRIPGIVTLADGTVIATTDARWNHAGDGAGLDTIVSVTKNKGQNWTYTFANYLGDNGNVFNNLSTSIIDPAIATNGTTAYMIADLFPAGIALNTSKYGPIAKENGFDDNGNLMLRDLAGDTVVIAQDDYNTMAGDREYNFYLDLGTYEICTINGSRCEDFTVDEYFNITYTDDAGVTHTTNLFFADSPFQPYPTDYLYLVSTTDGLNWSAPKLLNLQAETEQTLLVGPGNGTYDAVNKRMIFTAYRHTGGASGANYECACLIWMDEFGNWFRSEDATTNSWSSEASCVVLDDGTVRIFYRDGFSVLRYTDYKWDAAQNNYFRDPNATEVQTIAAKCSGCQLSAIKYSEPINGKDAILVSTPNAGGRSDGHLYVFLLDENNKMELAYAYDIVPDTNEDYAYSCITELDDGNIGLLYESAASQLTYEVLDITEITDRDNDARLTFVDLDILSDDSVTVTDPTGDHTGADTSELDEEVATVDMTVTSKTAVTAQLGSNANYDGNVIDLADCLYTFTKGEDGKWIINNGDLYLNTNGTAGIPHGTASCTFTIEAGNESGTFYIRGTGDSNNNKNYLYFDRAACNWNRVNDLQNKPVWMANCSMSLFRLSEGEGTGEIPGYDRITVLDDVTDGEYLIGAKGNNGGWYVAHPSTSSNSFNHIAKVADSATTYTTHLTFTGVAEGYTEVVIGSTLYRINVADYLTVNKTVTVGETIRIETDSNESVDVGNRTKLIAYLEDGFIVVEGLYPGVTTVTQGRMQYLVDVKGRVISVKLTEGESASYVIPGTDADMTQPNTSAITIGNGTGMGTQVGSAQSVYAGKYVALEDCLYTFAPNGDQWIVSARGDDGTTVFLQPYAATNGYPHSDEPVNVTLSQGNSEDSVYIYGNGGYLYFYRDGKLYFDRVNKTQGFEKQISFLLYRPAAEGETSSTEIPGFVKVAGKDAVTEGQYLIVAKADNGEYYVAYPSMSQANRSAQIAHVVSDATTVVISALAECDTSFRVASTVYEVVVEKKIHTITTSDVDMGSTQGMEFAFAADDKTDWTGAYVQILLPGTGEAMNIPRDQWKETEIDGKKHFVVDFVGVASTQMMDEIRVTMFNAQGEAISGVHTDTVRDYVVRALENAETNAEKTMLIDMLNYGAAAQLHFGYNTGNLANEGLEEYQVYASQTTITKNNQVKDTGYSATTLEMESQLQLNLLFLKSKVTKSMKAVITYTDADGKVQTITVNGSDFKSHTNNRWRIEIKGLTALDADTVFTCNIYSGSTLKASASDSINSYLSRAVNGGGGDLYLMALRYNQSARAYADLIAE